MACRPSSDMTIPHEQLFASATRARDSVDVFWHGRPSPFLDGTWRETERSGGWRSASQQVSALALPVAELGGWLTMSNTSKGSSPCDLPGTSGYVNRHERETSESRGSEKMP